eukprot:3063313-Rhodomonas_salina.1
MRRAAKREAQRKKAHSAGALIAAARKKHVTIMVLQNSPIITVGSAPDTRGSQPASERERGIAGEGRDGGGR